ncbi:hypothetical protein ACOSP7_012559 [Xanthoceras sorbifolium]
MGKRAKSHATSCRPSPRYLRSKGLGDRDRSPGYLRSKGLRDQNESPGASRSNSARGYRSATRDQYEQIATRSGKEPKCYDETSQGNDASQNHRQKARGCHSQTLINQASYGQRN